MAAANKEHRREDRGQNGGLHARVGKRSGGYCHHHTFVCPGGMRPAALLATVGTIAIGALRTVNRDASIFINLIEPAIMVSANPVFGRNSRCACDFLPSKRRPRAALPQPGT